MTSNRPRCIAPLLVAFVIAAPTSARSDLLPAGDFVDEAVALDINASFFSFLLDEVLASVPPTLVVGATAPAEVIDLWLCGQDYWIENLTIYTEFHVAAIQSTSAGFKLVLTFDLAVNTPGNPAWIVLDGCIDDACGLWVDPAQVHVELPFDLSLSTNAAGEPFVDLEFGALQQDITDAMISNMAMGSCALTSINAWWMENVGEDLIDTMIGEAIGEIDGTITGKLDELEVQAEEALQALWISGETVLLEVPVLYEIEPTAIQHSFEGLRIVLGGRVDAAKAPCISALDPGGSLRTASPTPEHYDNGWHIRSLLGDELINQGLYGVWRGGVLCFEASQLGDTSLTTSMLALLLGEVFEQEVGRLMPYAGDSPVLIRTMPWNPPRARFDGAHDIMIEVIDLDIEFYVPLLDRWSRLTAVTIDIVAGIDLELTPEGAMKIDVALLDDAFVPAVTYDELSPAIGDALLDNFGSILDIAIGAIAGDALGGGELLLPLPTVGGLGLADMYTEPDGLQLDFLSGYYAIGPSEGGGELATGCADGGCGDEGGGCADGEEGCALGGEGCGGEEGGCISEEGGCDVQDVLISQGCSGEANPEPTDTGCSGDLIEAACRTSGGPRVRAHTGAMLLITLALLGRRRRR